MAGHGHIGNVGRRNGNTVVQPDDGIDADMGLQAEIPLVALLGLLHLRIALLGLVLGRGSDRHDGGVDDGALAHEQALLGQSGVDLLEDPLGQGMLLQQMAETQRRGGVWHALDGQVNTDEVAHGLAIVDSIFERLVGESVPLLKKVNTMHVLKTDGGGATPLASRVREVGRRHCLYQRLTWHQRLHLGQELLSGGNLLLVLAFRLSERDLLPRVVLSGGGRKHRCYPANDCQAVKVGLMQHLPNLEGSCST
jgi:hypothetical protein